MKATDVVLVKFEPVILTVIPTTPELGVMSAIAGGGVTLNFDRVAMPPGVVTEIFPEVAPGGTAATICVGDTTLNVAGWPPTESAEA